MKVVVKSARLLKIDLPENLYTMKNIQKLNLKSKLMKEDQYKFL